MKIINAEPLHRHNIQAVRLSCVDRLFLKKEREEPDFYRRMFDEDFSRIFKFIPEPSGDYFKITSNNDALIERLLGNIKVRHASQSVDETIRKSVEEIAQSLVRYGAAYHFLYEDTEQEEAHIVPLSPVIFVKLFGRHIQWVPRRTERHWDQKDEELPREIRILNANKTMHFDLPTSIKRMLATQNRTLAVLDKHRFELTDFHSQATHENPNPINHFDYSLWNDNQERALFRATRSTGWNTRNTSSSKCSDFFHCHRLIRFRRNQLFLRDDILRQLSIELSKVGKNYDSEFSVKITGTDLLPDIAHLNELEEKLKLEEVGFTEIFDYCHER